MCNTNGNDNVVCGTANIDVFSYTSLEDDIPQIHMLSNGRFYMTPIMPWQHPQSNPIDTPTAIFPTYDILHVTSLVQSPYHQCTTSL